MKNQPKQSSLALLSGGSDDATKPLLSAHLGITAVIEGDLKGRAFLVKPVNAGFTFIGAGVSIAGDVVSETQWGQLLEIGFINPDRLLFEQFAGGVANDEGIVVRRTAINEAVYLVDVTLADVVSRGLFCFYLPYISLNCVTEASSFVTIISNYRPALSPMAG